MQIFRMSSVYLSQLGLSILIFIHNATVAEDGRVEFPHDNFDVSKASMTHVHNFLSNNGVTFTKTPRPNSGNSPDEPFPIQKEFLLPSVYVAPTEPGCLYGGCNGNKQYAKLDTDAINFTHRNLTKISKSYSLQDNPRGTKLWEPTTTKSQKWY